MTKFIIIRSIALVMLIIGVNYQLHSQSASSIKLFRFGEVSNEKPGVVIAGKHIDVSSFGEDYNEKFFASDGITRLKKWLEKNQSKCPEVASSLRFASCVARPSKIVAIGLNYLLHVQESNIPVPKEPVIFMKATTAMCGPFDKVIIPKNSTKTDYEVELAVIIGKKASNVSVGDASSYVADYSIINDYSEREWQLERPATQWDKGKSADTFAPLGPYLVTPAEVGDPHNLSIWLTLNGKKVQDANTSDMIFKVEQLISDVSKYMTLLPGDVIATGTPSGVGLGKKPPLYLKPGDVVELGIEKLGTQKQTLVAAQ
jgi:2,4-diketo-3-deoxy-L-fuconate hydrolase